MNSYHVYFSTKEGFTDEEMVEQVHAFMATQIEGNLAKGYRLLNYHKKASFDSIPDFHLIVDYQSNDDLEEAFRSMKQQFKEEPHAPLMKMVGDFRVAFSSDV